MNTNNIKLIITLILFYSANSVSDCIGPAVTSIVLLEVEECSNSKNYDSTIEIKANAYQIYEVQWENNAANNSVKLVPNEYKLKQTVFWASETIGCDAFDNTEDQIWLYDDICNDTGQNIPSMQLQKMSKSIYRLLPTK